MRVRFGAGSRHRLDEELKALGMDRVLLIADPAQQECTRKLAGQLGARCVGVFDGVVQHVPIQVAQAGRSMARNLRADCCVTVGGGSATGLGKAIALETDVALVAVPTTYAGSEMTPIWGLTEGGVKRTGRDPRVRPRVTLYDPELTATMPPGVAGPSGMNAVAHCVEALYAHDGNPIMSLLAEEGVRALARALPRILVEPDDPENHGEALYGAWLAGVVLGSVDMALHHKICHVLGGTFNTPHAETHAIILPYASAYNLQAAPEAERRLAAALGTARVARGLRELALAVGAPATLMDLGLSVSDLERATELVTRSPCRNPRDVTRDGVRKILQDAYRGVTPGVVQLHTKLDATQFDGSSGSPPPT